MKYFSYYPNDGFIFHETEKEAKAECEKAFGYAKDEAGCDGWGENVDDICWGEIRGRVKVTESIMRPPAEEIEDGEDEAGNDWSNPDWDRIEKREIAEP